MQKIAALVQVSRPFHRRVPGHLLHPARVRVPRYSAQRHSATANLDEEKDVVSDEPTPRQHFYREKVGTREHVYVGPDKLLPGACATPLRRGCNLVSAQNVADGLIGNEMAQIGQRPRDAIITRAAIFTRKADH
jgi:hypothetical protein